MTTKHHTCHLTELSYKIIQNVHKYVKFPNQQLDSCKQVTKIPNCNVALVGITALAQ